MRVALRMLSVIRGYLVSRELQSMNQQNKLALWAGRISECRNGGQNVKAWCREHGVPEQTDILQMAEGAV